MDKINSIGLVVKAIGAEVGSKYYTKMTALNNKYRTALSNYKIHTSKFPKGLDRELFETVFLRGMAPAQADELRTAYNAAGSSINLPDDIRKRYHAALNSVVSDSWLSKAKEVKDSTARIEASREKVRQTKKAIQDFRVADDPAFKKTVGRHQQKYGQVSPLDVAARMEKELGSTYAQAYMQKVNAVRDALNQFGKITYGTDNFADTDDAMMQLIPAYTQTAAQILSLHKQRNGAPLEESDGEYEMSPKAVEQRREAGRASGQKRAQQAPAPAAPKRRGRGRLPVAKTLYGR